LRYSSSSKQINSSPFFSKKAVCNSVKDLFRASKSTPNNFERSIWFAGTLPFTQHYIMIVILRTLCSRFITLKGLEDRKFAAYRGKYGTALVIFMTPKLLSNLSHWPQQAITDFSRPNAIDLTGNRVLLMNCL
jgi:hypothetical protein